MHGRRALAQVVQLARLAPHRGDDRHREDDDDRDEQGVENQRAARDEKILERQDDAKTCQQQRAVAVAAGRRRHEFAQRHARGECEQQRDAGAPGKEREAHDDGDRPPCIDTRVEVVDAAMRLPLRDGDLEAKPITDARARTR